MNIWFPRKIAYKRAGMDEWFYSSIFWVSGGRYLPLRMEFQTQIARNFKISYVGISFNYIKMNILIPVFAMTACVNSIGDFAVFHLTQGYRVTSQKIVATQENTAVKCAILCRMSTECRIASYSISLEQCFLSSSWYTDPMDFQIVEESSAVLLRKLEPSKFYGMDFFLCNCTGFSCHCGCWWYCWNFTLILYHMPLRKSSKF